MVHGALRCYVRLCLPPGSKRAYLGDKAKQVCRYCGRADPEVKFKLLAHAIPDQVGNNWLFDYEE